MSNALEQNRGCLNCEIVFVSLNAVLVCPDCLKKRQQVFEQRERLARFFRDYTGSRTALLAFYGNRCLRCGSSSPLVIDHVFPLAKGGRSDIQNLQPLCKKCNSSKLAGETDYRRGRILLYLSGCESSLSPLVRR